MYRHLIPLLMLSFALSRAGMCADDNEKAEYKSAPPAMANPHAQLPSGDELPDPKSIVETPAPTLEGTLPYETIKHLAIQDGGRKKPLAAYVFEEMEKLVGRPLFSSEPFLKDKISGRKISAMDLFLGMWLEREKWVSVPIVLVSDGALKKDLGLPVEEKYFSPQRLITIARLRELLDGGQRKRLSGEEKSMTNLEKEAEILGDRIKIVQTIMRGDDTLPIIPHPTLASGTWLSMNQLYTEVTEGTEKPSYSMEKSKELFNKFAAFRTAWQSRKASDFVTASSDLRETLVALSPNIYPTYTALDREVSYMDLRPFGKAWIFYFCAATLGLLALKIQSKPFYIALMATYLAGIALHVYGFALRCMIAGRPPVSNMYESVIWVGFGAVFFGLVFELIYKRRYFALSGALGGFLCLVLMDMLPAVTGNAAMPGFEAPIRPLQPVLRDNFWLTVHVLTITLSYAAFMLAWVLGHVTMFKHLFRPAERGVHHELHQFVYRAMQVGVLLLAIGTILGGVWAYYSWGRFWGWDPKETWAFIALMCYLFVLHGRFTGWWGNFGMSVGSVICFLSIVMAWYGVNFVLGSGMHAYGSGAGGLEYVGAMVAADLIFTGAAIGRYLTYKGANASVAGDDDDDDILGGGSKLSAADPIADARREFADAKPQI